MTFVPPQASEQSDASSNLLFDVETEAVFHSPLLSSRFDVWQAHSAALKSLYSFAIAAHIRVIPIGEQANGARPLSQKAVANLKLEVLAARATDVPIQLDAVCNLRHQAFSKAQSPLAVLILDHQAKCVATSVCCIVVGAIVIHRPVHKLEMAVAAGCVHIEEIGR